MSETACSHRFTFLRQDWQNEGVPGRNHATVYDVHYCQRCLEYRWVKLRETELGPRGTTVVVWEAERGGGKR